MAESDSEQPQGLAPRLIQVAPPKASLVDEGALQVLGIAVFWAYVWLSPGITTAGLVAAAGMLPFVVWALLASARRSARFNQRRAEFCQRHDAWDKEPVGAALKQRWRYCSLPPDGEMVEETLVREGVDRSRRGVVVVLGPLEVPEVGCADFEALTLRGARSGNPTLAAAILTALIGIPLLSWGLDRGVLPEDPLGFGAGLYVVPLLVPMVAVVLLAWFFVDRPTLVRLAPGTVEVSTCMLRESKRKTRAYPLTGGTLSIITQTVRKQTLTLVRAKQSDTVRLPSLRKTTEWERIWQSLLSTAPPPPLSDEELVG